MADYYTNFSFAIPKINKSEREWAEAEIRRREGERDADDCPLFDACWQFDEDGLWLYSDAGESSIDNTALFVQEFIKQFRPLAIFGFEWGNDCSKPRLDAYGGGAVVITAKKMYWMNTGGWMHRKVEQIEKRRSLKQK